MRPIPCLIPWRTIALLSLASFAGAANLRLTDALLVEISEDLGVSVGAAGIITAGFAIAYGVMQVVWGPIADKGVSKIAIVAVGSLLAGAATAAAALAGTLPVLTAARLLAGAMAAAVIPLAIAWIGDAVPYEQRQPVMARFLSGQLMGFFLGQAAGGIVGAAFGWRSAYIMLGAIHALAGLALVIEWRQFPPEAMTSQKAAGHSTLAEARRLLADRWVRIVLIAVGLEGAAMYGAFAYLGADIHYRHGLDLASTGLMLGGVGIGGLAYAWTAGWLIRLAGRPHLASAGGLLMAAAYGLLALGPPVPVATAAIMLLGFAFFLLHNTLQVEATQMAPDARGVAIALFAASLFLFQSLAIAFAGPIVDSFGTTPVLICAGLMLAGVGLWFSAALVSRSAG